MLVLALQTMASAEVDRICRKNHLSFTELLRPLGHELQGVGSKSLSPKASFGANPEFLVVCSVISFRTSKSYNLKNFGVRFVSSSEVGAIEPKVRQTPALSVVAIAHVLVFSWARSTWIQWCATPSLALHAWKTECATEWT